MIRDVPADAGLLPGSFDIYDLYTVIFVLVAAVAVFSLLMWVLGLPGRIAIQRRHPHAKAVKIMGYAGALAVIPWIHAFIWAFHDSMTVDLRRFPEEQEAATEEELRKLTGQSVDGGGKGGRRSASAAASAASSAPIS